MYNNGCPEPEHAELERKVEILEEKVTRLKDALGEAVAALDNLKADAGAAYTAGRSLLNDL